MSGIKTPEPGNGTAVFTSFAGKRQRRAFGQSGGVSFHSARLPSFLTDSTTAWQRFSGCRPKKASTRSR